MSEITEVNPNKQGESWADVPIVAVWQSFVENGAVLLRGFEGDSESFSRLTQAFCASFMVNKSPGRATLRGTGAGIQTANLGGDIFPFHPEYSHKPWRPEVCWFWYASEPRDEGNTLACNGTLVAQDLSKSTRRLFESKGLRYCATMDASYLLGAFNHDNIFDTVRALKKAPFADAFRLLDDGSVLQDWSTEGLYKARFCSELTFGNFLLFSRQMYGNYSYPTFADGSAIADEVVQEIDQITKKHTIPIVWQKHDLLMLDNFRFMHARQAFKDDGKRLLMTRFGYLRDKPFYNGATT